MCIGFQIYLDAKTEADMEQNFRALQRHWEQAEFLHTRFIIAVQQQQGPQLGDGKEKNVSPQNAPNHHIIDGGTFTIIGKLYTLPSIQLVSAIGTDGTVVLYIHLSCCFFSHFSLQV